MAFRQLRRLTTQRHVVEANLKQHLQEKDMQLAAYRKYTDSLTHQLNKAHNRPASRLIPLALSTCLNAYLLWLIFFR